MGWDDKRHYEEHMEEKVFKYLREHPELQNETRYSTFRFWRQVSVGSTKEEVKVLLDDPDERTIDPALLASLARRHWSQVQGKAKEAWVYPLGWVLYIDDKAVVSMIRARTKWDKDDDQYQAAAADTRLLVSRPEAQRRGTTPAAFGRRSTGPFPAARPPPPRIWTLLDGLGRRACIASRTFFGRLWW
jgi:hypothetical protein